MKTEIKNDRKHVICDNLEEFFVKFKKYRNAKSDIAKRENYSEHVFPYLPIDKSVIDGKKSPKYFLVDLDYSEPKTEPFWSLGLDISPANIKEAGIESEWDKKDKEIRKILHEIWETGEIKSAKNLDLNWPAVSQPDQNRLPNDTGLKEENKRLKEQLKKETNHKIIWTVIFISAVIIFLLTILFCLLKIKKLKKH